MLIHPECWDMFGVSAENGPVREDSAADTALGDGILYRITQPGGGVVFCAFCENTFKRFSSEEEAKLYFAAAGTELKNVVDYKAFTNGFSGIVS